MPHIQRASGRHAEDIAALLLAAFQEFQPLYTTAGFQATTPPPEEITRRLDEGPTWIACEASVVVGTVSATHHNDELHIRSMAVLPGLRGRGIASELLKTAEAHARELGVRRLTLSTTPFLLAAISLYERAGFRRVGEHDLHGTPLIDMARDSAGVSLRRFEDPDETRLFEQGRFEVVTLGGMTIGRATYSPGWRWSTHVGAPLGATHCTIAHVGLVISGHATVAMADGIIHDLTSGTLFSIPAEPHDSWVVGDTPYVSLHFLGAAAYATGNEK